MINRDLIRTKIVQLTYACNVNGNDDMNNAEKELLFSLSKAYDLYLFLLNFMVNVRDEAENQWMVTNNRSQREGKGDVSRNFIDNKFILQLRNSEQFAELVERKKQNWENDLEAVHNVLQLIEQTPQYANYMALENPSYEDDKDIWRVIYKTIISSNDAIDNAIEEQSLYWNDDKYVVDTFVLKTIRRFEEEKGVKQELLEEYRNQEDKNFAIQLFRAANDNRDEYREYMAEESHNWDISRLSTMDIILLQIAIAEMLTFPEIAIHVTINEYIELAKIYSTPKSAGYINGMLDAIARKLVAKGLMLKPLNNKK